LGSDEAVIEALVDIFAFEIEISKAKRGDVEAKNIVFTQIAGLISYVVDTTLKRIGNPRILMEAEDLKQEVSTDLQISSLEDYDSSKSGISTFFTWHIRGALSNYLRKLNTDKRGINYSRSLESFQDEASRSNGNERITLDDITGRYDTNFEKIELREFVSRLSVDERNVLDLIMGGYEPREIPRKLDTTPLKLEDFMKSIRKKAREYFS